MKNLHVPSLLLALVLIAGCTTVYTGIVTTTTVVKTAMTMWADASVAGQTSAAVDAKVIAAHDKYRGACAAAAGALEAYKLSGDPAQYQQAVAEARNAGQLVLELIKPLIAPTDAANLQTKYSKAVFKP